MNGQWLAIPNAFRTFIGVDYSGAGLPGAALGNLRVYRASMNGAAQEVVNEQDPQGQWSRARVRDWLLREVAEEGPALCGIDHGFSLPANRLQRHGIATWNQLLALFEAHVTTHLRRVSEARVDPGLEGLLDPPEGQGAESWFRLSERRTQQASSVLDFRPRRVAFSTMAGIAQLAVLRGEAANAGVNLHFWPFDGFDIPAGHSAIVEIYPALLKRRFAPVAGDTDDQRDARSAADWLRTIVMDGHLETYLRPPLTAGQREQVLLEGWILGVM